MKKFIALICALALALPLAACATTDKAAIVSESFSLSRGEFTYFFVRTMQSSLASYDEDELAELGYDKSLSPSEQKYDVEQTWFDLFLDGATDYVRELLALCEAAKKAGVALDAGDGLEKKLSDFRARIESTYSVSFETYLDITYYGYTSETEFNRAFELELLANKMMSRVSEGIYAAIGDGRISDYIEKNIKEPDLSPTRSIFLTVVESEARADEILSLYNGSNFEELAEKHSISAAFTYENCRRGELFPALDSWLFADGTEIGDIAKIKDGDKFTVALYSAEGRSVSELDALDVLARADYRKFLEALFSEFPVITNGDVLATLDI